MLDRETSIDIIVTNRAELIELQKEIELLENKDKRSIELLKLLDKKEKLEFELENAEYCYNSRYLQYDINNGYQAWHDRLVQEDTHSQILIHQFASYLYKNAIVKVEVVPSLHIPILATIRTVGTCNKVKLINSISYLDKKLRNATNEFLNIHGVDIIVYFKNSTYELIDLKCIENQKLKKFGFGATQGVFITIELTRKFNNQIIDSYVTDPQALNKYIWYYIADTCVYVIDRLKLKEYIENTNKVLIQEHQRDNYIKSKDYSNIYTHYRKRDNHLQADINVEILIEKDIAKYYSYSDFKDTEYSHKVIDK
ncbi:MAG: hypothetical protein RR657_06550 [Peptostreptococcaceae bacterium]